MINNIKLFEFSLQNPEPIMDESYFKHSDLIISHKASQPTQLMKNNFELLEAISAFSFARKNNSSGVIDLAIEKILKLTKHKNINYSEFVSFWPTLDLSHSIFAKLSAEQQRQALKQIVEKYLDSRHELIANQSNKILKNLRTCPKSLPAMAVNGGFAPLRFSRIYPFKLKKLNHKIVVMLSLSKHDSRRGLESCFDRLSMTTIFTLDVLRDRLLESVRIYLIRCAAVQSKFTISDSSQRDLGQALRSNPKNYFVNTAGFKKLLHSL